MIAARERWTSQHLACRAAVLMAILPLLVAKPAMPRFKWGQSKEQIYMSVMVRDLDPDTVAVALPSSGQFTFQGKTTKGEEYALDLELREDVVVKVDAPLKFVVGARSSKWGTAVEIILTKENKHRWDLLVSAEHTKKYKKVLDKDWTKEDQTLEPDEETPYVEDNSQYLVALTAKNKQKTTEKFNPVLVNVRYPWCNDCKSQDETFVKAAKAAKAMAKKDKKWKKAAFAVVDAREERKLAREMDAKCSHTCEYRVFTGPDEEPELLKSQWSEMELLNKLSLFLSPAVHVFKDSKEADAFKETNLTCLGQFSSESSPEYKVFKKVAARMRGELVFAASFAASSNQVELWPVKQKDPFKYEGTLQDNGTALLDWVKPRSLPLLQEYDWQLREKYENLRLPIAKVWINDADKNPSFEKIVRHAVRRLAKKFVGRIAFVEQKKSTYSYELRDFGLQHPEVYPAFGIASNASYNSVKYGFEVTDKVAESAETFWKDADHVVKKLELFCEEVLAGTWPQAHESGPAQTNWTKGTVKQLAWKSYNEISSPEKPLLLALYGKYRAEHENKVKEAAHLATALDSAGVDSFVVASLDTSDNYVPADDFKRDKYASDTEWFWVPAKGADSARPAVKKLMKPKKDAPMKTVIEFAAKQSGVSLEDVVAKFEKLMADDPPTVTPPPLAMDGMGAGQNLGARLGTGKDGLGDIGGMGDMGDMAGMPDIGDYMKDMGNAGAAQADEPLDGIAKEEL